MDLPAYLADHAAVARQAAGESFVLLKNEQSLLPLAPGTAVAVFGVGQIHTVRGGTGSGEVNALHTVSLLEGLRASSLRVDAALAEEYTRWAEAHPPAEQGMFARGESRNHHDELPVEQLDLSAAAKRCSTALVVISRIAGEGEDMRPEKGSFCLTDTEDALLRNVRSHFPHMAILLNTALWLDLGEHADTADALLFLGLPGQEGGHAAADVLTGAVLVSGKLAFSWPERYEDGPTAAEFGRFIPSGHHASTGFGIHKTHQEQTLVPYREDIYVGYRYFDSFGLPLRYPFGFGLSYGAPELGDIRAELSGESVILTAAVRNASAQHRAREVLQLYATSPDGVLEHPAQELRAFAKSRTLAPGEQETLRLCCPLRELASYDTATASWLLEAGFHQLRVGSSSRDTRLAALLYVSHTMVTRRGGTRLSQMNGDFAPLRKPPVPTAAADPGVPVLTVPELTAEELHRAPPAAPAAAPPDLTLRHVLRGEATVEQLAASLSTDELCRLVCGQGMDFSGFAPNSGDAQSQDVFARLVNSLSDPAARFEVAGEAGQSPDLRDPRGIPPLVLADGPAGLRLRRDLPDGRHQYCTAFPTGSLLACSFDRELWERFGAAVGSEMAIHGVDLWLAPGMNLQRDPLCGRNFEYFSEDPLLSGSCAAAITRGVQSRGGGVTIKHFAANNQEFMRGCSNDLISERALRELYLRGFERCVREAAPLAVMTAYNDINGVPCADSAELCTALLRDEWGFTGLVMTDWGGGCSSPVLSLWAGNDMIQPGGPLMLRQLQEAYRTGEPCRSQGMAGLTVTPERSHLERSAAHILAVILRCPCALSRLGADPG